jgi:glyoxylase-like metal-dependent hydrolase (beta-lactamase superfamily II)
MQPDPDPAVEPIPAFNDNYLGLMVRGARAAVVDPGDAEPVLRRLQQRELKLEAILVTHHHGDHVGGVGFEDAGVGAGLGEDFADEVEVVTEGGGEA